jgi:hypothetical protein
MKVNSTVNEQDEARVKSQCKAILERLRQGPATSGQLAQISLKYTGRISELRQAGYDIPKPVRQWRGGALYTLVQD